MKRKQVYIEDQQEELLKRRSRELGVSEAELVRQGIDEVLRAGKAPRPDRSSWQREKRFIEQLIKKGPVEGGRRWKREDLYERGLPRR